MPEGVEHHTRQGESGSYEFYLNHGSEVVTIEQVNGNELITGKTIDGTLTLGAYDAAVVSVRKNS
jgi:beta-galactosidase GanA